MAEKGGAIANIREAARNASPAPDLRTKKDEAANDTAPILPPGCPVTPLGIQGLKLWVLDAANQMISFPTDCRKGDMMLIFGGDEWLTEKFPQVRVIKGEKGSKPQFEIVGFDQTQAQRALVMACHRKGIFSPLGRVFGRGAHLIGPDKDQLVLHIGNRVLMPGANNEAGNSDLVEHPAGAIDGAFFPALPALPAPASTASTTKHAADLLRVFGQWYWVEQRNRKPGEPASHLDPDASPLLLLGMVAQMFVCGALEWRSHVWLAGPTAAGKSSLQKLIRAILADWCLHTEDASEAAIRQVLNDDTLPVMIDEAEADDNPEKQRAILNLAKKASSGAKMYRGSADHKAQEFKAQSCFLFSSVLHGLVKGEERNRMAILDMRQVPKTTAQWEAPDLSAWRAIGRQMQRRMVEQWPRFQQTLTDYKREIWSHGLEGRWQDTFGTLLACADLLLFDGAPSRESELNPEHGREATWVRAVLPMMRRGKSEARTDVERCIAYLMSRQIPGANGKPPESIGQWVMRAMNPLPVEPEQDWATAATNEDARSRLKQYGLRLVLIEEGAKGPKVSGEPLPNAEGWKDGHLLVAYSTCQPLLELFRGTEWANGGWLQSLGKVEGVKRGSAMKQRFAGPNAEYGIAIPLPAIKGEAG